MKVLIVKDADKISRRSRSGIIIHFSEGRSKEVNVRDLEGLIVLGSEILIESGVISLLSSFNIPISIVSKLGVSLLSTHTLTYYNEVRRAQYRMEEKEKQKIMFEILLAKFKGISNIIKYYEKDEPSLQLLEELENGKISLLTWEAVNSKAFWKEVLSLIPDKILEDLKIKYKFRGREPKAIDPFNRSVSLLYSILYTTSMRALVAAGLDPTEGLHHRTRYSTPLVFDYVEMYKPIALHTVLKVIRSEEGKLELDRDNNLTKESIEFLLKEFFSIMQAKIRNKRLTPSRSIYINAYKLAQRIKGDCKVKYTFVYNPKKLIFQ